MAPPGLPRALTLALLLAITFVWGVTFTVVKEAVARVDVAVFLAQRFLAAFALLAAIAAAGGGRLDRRTLLRGGAMGGFLFLGYLTQTYSLRFTTASNAAFLTGLAVVLVPFVGALLFRERVAPRLGWAAVLAAAGLWLLTTGGTLRFNAGDALAAACAVCIALHVVLTGRYAAGSDVAWLTAVEIGVVAAGSLALAVGTGAGAAVRVWHPFLLWPYVFCVLFATVLAFLVQTAAQRRLDATHTALVLCLEPVFAALWARAVLGERLGPVGTVGAVLILAAMLFAEICSPRCAIRHR
jgi:drug/metabolite transporter (DMT)-like permease